MYGLQAFARSMICQMYSAIFFGDGAIVIGIPNDNTQAPLAPVNHHQLQKYFISTHPAPTGTLLKHRQIDNKGKYILMHPNVST